MTISKIRLDEKEIREAFKDFLAKKGITIPIDSYEFKIEKEKETE